jgi:hypothetical protein
MRSGGLHSWSGRCAKRTNICPRFYFYILYFVDRASRYKCLVITNLTYFFMCLFISCLYMFRASQRSSSGDRIVLIHHLVRLVCVSDCLVCRPGGNYSSLLTHEKVRQVGYYQESATVFCSPLNGSPSQSSLNQSDTLSCSESDTM